MLTSENFGNPTKRSSTGEEMKQNTPRIKTDQPKDRESMLSHIVDVAQVGLCYLDTNLRYSHINDWLADINGLTVKQHLGRTIRELFPNLAPGIEPQFQQVIDTGNPIIKGRVHAETPSQPGVKRLFEHSYFADKSADGTIVGISCLVEEIAEFKRLESKEFDSLSPREFEVMNLVNEQYSSKQIADILCISLRTVSKHREQIRKKLGLEGKKINLSAFLRALSI